MSELQSLLLLLDEAFERKAWHGPNLKGSIRGVSARQAVWRPASGRHNIWELVAHAAYWKYAVRRRLLGEKRGSFALTGSNWFPCPAEPAEREWKKLTSLLTAEHRKLRAAAATLRSPAGPQARLLRGAASHDLYHAGQIQMLKRLCPVERQAS